MGTLSPYPGIYRFPARMTVLGRPEPPRHSGLWIGALGRIPALPCLPPR
jgi:hypothetical protein